MNDLEILSVISDIGYLLLKHGAEIYRVEESLKRMCEGFGFQDVEVFAVPSYFIVSLTLHDGSTHHISRRSRANRIHLDHLYSLNSIVRALSKQTMTLEEAKEKITVIQNKKSNLTLVLIGYILSAAFFCSFFGGNMDEIIVSGIIGFVIYFFIYLMELVNVNSLVRTMLSSMLLSSIAIISYKIGFIDQLQSTITGSLMLLVPGIAITNSLRDIIGGDFISGVSRMIEAFLIATSIAIGVGIMMMLFGVGGQL